MIKKYKEICNAIVVQFCAKQEMDFNGWIADEVGGIAECSDFYFNFGDIVKDIDRKVDKEVIIDWYYSNIDNWLESGEPADKETSKRLYDEAKKTISKALS